MKEKFKLIVKAPGEHSKHNYVLVQAVGTSRADGKPIFAAVFEVSTCRSSADNFSDATEKARAEKLAELWNSQP